MTEMVYCHCERSDVGLTLVDENFTVILRSCKDRRISDEFVKIDTSASPQYDDVLAVTVNVWHKSIIVILRDLSRRIYINNHFPRFFT